MTVGAGIVVATVLVLATFNAAFRRGLFTLISIATAAAVIFFMAYLEEGARQAQEQAIRDAARNQAKAVSIPADEIEITGARWNGDPTKTATLNGTVTNHSRVALRAFEIEITATDCNHHPAPGEQPCHVVGQVERWTQDINVPAGQARAFTTYPLEFDSRPVTEKAASAISREFQYRVTRIYAGAGS
jgi:hypothetical protein